MRRSIRFLATTRFLIPLAVVLGFPMLLGASVLRLSPSIRGAKARAARVATPSDAINHASKPSAHLLSVQSAMAATVQTDKPDYYPGQIVTITGSGWQPGETVTLLLQEDPPLDTHPLLYTTADGSGNIFNNQFSPDVHDTGVTFTLTATGQTSGLQA